MARRTWKKRLIYLALWLIIAAVIAFALIRSAQGWTPSRGHYPLQGLSVSSANGPIAWNMVKARDADFAYLRASTGAARRDPAFAANLEGARTAGLRYGPAHEFSLCSLASDQATLFISTVPRESAMLPPVVRLHFTPRCSCRPTRAAVLSELNTFLNLIEAHMGKPALIRVSQDFEQIYDISGGINRTLWLEGNVFSPNYASRPWVMWTASDFHRIEGIGQAVEWDVVRP
ncbi:MAG: glycoside hydrolase family 25 [Alphaproteobacteria bacterium]|nr:glycoside hydrolase family 25 [Alphaproteobacteria bacterium]